MNIAKVVAWLRAFAWIVIAGVGLWILTQIHYTIVTFGLAAIMSYLLYPWVNGLYTRSLTLIGRQLSWSVCVLLVYITLPVIVGGVMSVAVPAFNTQVDIISRNLPQQMDKLQRVVTDAQARFEKARLPAPVRQQLQSLIGQGLSHLAEVATNFVGHVANGIFATLTWLVFLIVALIISQFMLLNLPEMRRGFYAAVPDRFRDEVRQLMHEVNFVFGGFIKGTCLLCFIAALAVYALLNSLTLLAWLGIPGFVPFEYTLVIALLTLFCYPIPILGLAGITLLGGLAAYFQNGSAPYIVTVVGILVGAFTAVDRLVGPRVMSKAMGVSPLFVMFAAFAGAELMGFGGMILGVPVAAAIKVLFRYVRRRFLVPQEGDLDMATMIVEMEGSAVGLLPHEQYKAAALEHPEVSEGASGLPASSEADTPKGSGTVATPGTST